MPPTPSITDTKSHFLQTQTRLLSTPLHPSPTWQNLTTNTTSTTSPPAPLPEKTLSDLIAKTNAQIKSHNRLVFSIPSQRHVAEQIDTLYWNEVTSTHDAEKDGVETVWIPRDADLADLAVLNGLPGQIWDGDDDDEKRVRYIEMKTRATDLAGRRAELRRKVAAYRDLRGLLAPFEDVKRDVQGNLVGREAELARELERMRVLVARVVGGLGRRVELGVVGEKVDGDGRGRTMGLSESESESERVARVLELG